MEPKRWWSRTSVICVLVGLLGACLYLPTLTFGFVNLDDPWLIRDNLTLQHWSWSNLHAIWLDLSTAQRLRLGGEFLPVRDMSVLLDYWLFGDWIGGFHLTNVLLYGLLCAGVAGMIASWMESPLLAWIAGTLYAVHPLHVEAVAWLSERKGLLAGTFLMLALLLFRGFAQRGSWAMWFGATLALVLAIWSKALAITGIGILAALLWFFPPWQRTQPRGLRVWSGWGLLSVVGVLAFVPVWLTGQKVNMVQGFHGGSWWATLQLMAKVHGMYWQQLFLASGYAVKYPIQPGQGHLWLGILGTLLAVGVLGVALVGLWRPGWRVASFAAWCWLIFLAPVSQLIFPLQNYIADRYMLLPSLAFALLVAEALRRGLQTLPRSIVWGFCVLLAAALTLGQTQSWASTRALYLQAIRVHPRWVDGMMQLAHIEAKRGRLQQAQGWVQRAKQINPHHPKVALRASLLLLQQGKPKDAMQVLLRAVKSSRDDKIRANLALLFQRQGRLKEAYRWAKEAVEIRPLLPHNQRVFGVIALHLRRLDVAEKAFRQALHLQPHHPQNMMNMAALLLQRGDKAKAQQWWYRAQQIIQQRRR